MFLFFQKSSWACECYLLSEKEMKLKSYEREDLVFLGELISENKKTGEYYFRVLDSFKGELHYSQILKGRGRTTCSKESFSEGNLWLIYAHYGKDSTIDISICSASRSINNPFVNPPYPNDKEANIEDLNRELSILKQRYEALANWISDVEIYRYDSQENHTKNKEQTIFIYLSIANLILMLIIVLYLFRTREMAKKENK